VASGWDVLVKTEPAALGKSFQLLSEDRRGALGSAGVGERASGAGR
jgi:hypothetical protein